MVDHIWVRTDPVPGGGYQLTVEFDADTAAILSRVEAR